MRQLDNLFGPHIKEFKKKFNDTPSIDISFHSVGDGENGESLYRVSISYLDNFVSDVMSSEDEWERVGKMFDKLITDTDVSLRRLAERSRRINTMEIEMPRYRFYGGNTFTPIIDSEPVEARPFVTHWDGEIRDTGETPESAYARFCESLEEV